MNVRGGDGYWHWRWLHALASQEFLVADGVLPALGLLQKARKARIQPCHLATSWLLLAARTMMMMMTMMTELHGLTERFLRCACVGADLAVVLARPVCCCN
jgi:hypothetical protein